MHRGGLLISAHCLAQFGVFPTPHTPDPIDRAFIEPPVSILFNDQ